VITAESAEATRREREALLGQTIAGRYLVRRLVGHGGMGAVYEAEHVGIGKRVAIKFVDPEFAKDERVVARFAREARAMSALESAHIVSVLDAGSEHGRPYLVMELLRGEDLGARLRRERKIALADTMHVAAQVLKGLARAHAAGIVHRDLKPDNVFLLRSDTDPLFAKIVDFGVSKIERPRDRTSPLALTGRGTVLGTPFYMCPEQAQAQPDIDGRADLYSLGAIVFECLTGRPPHTGETYEQVIVSICMRDAPDLRVLEPSLPSPVAAFVERALARDRALRFTSAERMLAALHDIAPVEKQRVPLDPPSPETWLSAGNAPPSVATRISGSELAPRSTAPEVPRAKAASVPAAPSTLREAAEVHPAPAATRPSGPPRRVPSLLLTAVGATFAGVALMLLIVQLLNKPKPPPAATITSASATASSAPSVSAPVTTILPVVVASSASPTPKPPPTKPKPKSSALDIARDLP